MKGAPRIRRIFGSIMHLVDKLHDVPIRNDVYEICVSRQRWEAIGDRTWEPLTNLREDIPDLEKYFPHTLGKRNLKAKILKLYY